MTTGRGAVALSVDGELVDVVGCHNSQQIDKVRAVTAVAYRTGHLRSGDQRWRLGRWRQRRPERC